MPDKFRSQVQAARNAALRAVGEEDEEAFVKATLRLTTAELRRLRIDAEKLGAKLRRLPK